MKRHAKKAFDALTKINAPVINHCAPGECLSNQWGAHFILSGERRDRDDLLFADYYQEEVREWVDDNDEIHNAFGIRDDVAEILRANGLFAEWIDGGTVGIYDA